MPLIDRIVAEYPVRLDLTDLAAAACEQFESFAGLTEKLPKPLEGTNIQNILEFGWPLAIVGANPSFEWLRNRVTKEIARTGHASRSDWAVIHAGALLTALGARVTFLREVKKQGTRTPDIRASFDDQVIDFEVTYPKIRRRSRELQQLITEVNLEVDKIYRGEPYYLFVYIGEVELTSVGAEIIDAIRALPGKASMAPSIDGMWSQCHETKPKPFRQAGQLKVSHLTGGLTRKCQDSIRQLVAPQAKRFFRRSSVSNRIWIPLCEKPTALKEMQAFHS